MSLGSKLVPAGRGARFFEESWGLTMLTLVMVKLLWSRGQGFRVRVKPNGFVDGGDAVVVLMVVMLLW